MTTNEELIAEAIAYNESELADCEPEFRHFWDGWNPETVKAGTPVVTVVRTAPGLGRTSIFSVHLMIKLPDGKYVSVRDGHVDRVSTGFAARRNGLDGYAVRLAAKLYGAHIPVEIKYL